MTFSLDQVLTGLAVLLGLGGVGTGAGKAAGVFKSAMRMLGQIWLAICGDGTPENPGAVNRLTTLEKTVAKLEVTLNKHVDGDAPTWLADGQAWGNRLDADVASLDQRVSKLELASESSK